MRLREELELRIKILQEQIEFQQRIKSKYGSDSYLEHPIFILESEIKNIKELLKIEDLDKEFIFGKVKIWFYYQGTMRMAIEARDENDDRIVEDSKLENFFNDYICRMEIGKENQCVLTRDFSSLYMWQDLVPLLIKKQIKKFKENEEEITTLFNKFLDVEEYFREVENKNFRIFMGEEEK